MGSRDGDPTITIAHFDQPPGGKTHSGGRGGRAIVVVVVVSSSSIMPHDAYRTCLIIEHQGRLGIYHTYASDTKMGLPDMARNGVLGA